MKFWDDVGDFLYFPKPLPDCLFQDSFRRYSPLSLEVVEKPNKCKSFLAPIFWGGTTPTFLRQVVSAIYSPPFGKVWLSFVCCCPPAKPGNEVKCRIYGQWVKWWSTFKPFVDKRMATRINFYSYIAISLIRISDIANSNWRCRYIGIKVNSACHTNVHDILRWCRRSLVVANTLAQLSSMWPVLVVFHSASSEDRWRKKNKIGRRIAVRWRLYVGQPHKYVA